MKTMGFGLTDVGLIRSNNEDSFLADDDLGLYAVCDGMGGHSAGEVASAEAVLAVQGFLEEYRGEFTDARRRQDLDKLLSLAKAAVNSASAVVFEAARSASRSGMGTTLAMLFGAGGQGIVANVGDSRCYVLRNGLAAQVTSDHTYAEELMAAGVSRATASSYGHLLTRAVGVAVGIEETVDVDTFVIDLQHGDRILLCSDGLSEYFDTAQEIGDLIANESAEAIPDLLVRAANSRGGLDNITALVVAVEKTETRRNRWSRWRQPFTVDDAAVCLTII